MGGGGVAHGLELDGQRVCEWEEEAAEEELVDEVEGYVASFEEVCLDHGADTHNSFVEDEESEENDGGAQRYDYPV